MNNDQQLARDLEAFWRAIRECETHDITTSLMAGLGNGAETATPTSNYELATLHEQVNPAPVAYGRLPLP